VTYQLDRRARVRLDLFDSSGRHVRRLIQGIAGPGSYTVPWDGRDTRGEMVAAGVYLAQLSVDGVAESQKILRMR
jgi:flagellar hook assembly protein FlgD